MRSRTGRPTVQRHPPRRAHMPRRRLTIAAPQKGVSLRSSVPCVLAQAPTRCMRGMTLEQRQRPDATSSLGASSNRLIPTAPSRPRSAPSEHLLHGARTSRSSLSQARVHVEPEPRGDASASPPAATDGLQEEGDDTIHGRARQRSKRRTDLASDDSSNRRCASRQSRYRRP